jgi:two-component system, chemotaxis family, CheB/CheR fusion protein
MPAIGPKPSIDTSFQSLAEEKMAHAVGIILSGTGKDGACGIRAINSNEGITIAQSVESAKFDGMPNAAIKRVWWIWSCHREKSVMGCKPRSNIPI